jgi:hypothetical protein
MTNAEIAEGNNLIAEFMPDMVWRIPDNTAYTPYWRRVTKDGMCRKDYTARTTTATQEARFLTLGYQSDWNMLMPVVERIEDLGYDVEIKHTSTTIVSSEPLIEIEEDGALKINGCYNAILRFVKWHNSRNKS